MANIVKSNFHWASKEVKLVIRILIAKANPAVLDPTDRKATTGVGEPSYTSGVHWWKGTAAILKATVDRTNTSAIEVMKEGLFISSIPIFVRLVEPLNPYRSDKGGFIY